MLRKNIHLPAGFIEPCLPSPAAAPPSGPGWLHEVKHDGFRIMAHREGDRVRLLTRGGHDFAQRFPFAAGAIRSLNLDSCIIDGEAIVPDAAGLAVFDQLRKRTGH
jgi:bifunctional non-homologous end joining protein LigD